MCIGAAAASYRLPRRAPSIGSPQAIFLIGALAKVSSSIRRSRSIKSPPRAIPIKKAPSKIDLITPLGEEASEASVASLAHIVLAAEQP